MTALIFGSPGRYIQGDGLLDDIGQYIRDCSERALVLCDSFVKEQFGSRIAASCAAHEIDVHWLAFSGELTDRKVRELEHAAQSFDYGVVVAIGGGKTLDAGKALVDAAHCALITVPTVASNDSPTSKNYVVYDDDHQLAAVRHLPRSATYVLVDTTLIAQAPTHFLLAGIGDAISKYFEAEQCLNSGGKTCSAQSLPIRRTCSRASAFRSSRPMRRRRWPSSSTAALLRHSTGSSKPSF
ncbi:iron-containing alcohol dehydrogenase family protein [Burkholderia cepacia]|nr:iron-containing alcohol dehydrogenase family protein [Burkholderia cepacia]